MTDIAGTRPPASRGVELLGIEPLEEHARRLAAVLTPVRAAARQRPRAPDDGSTSTPACFARSTPRWPTMSGAASRPRPPPNGCSTTSTSSRRPFATSATTSRRPSIAACPMIADDEFAGLPRVYAMALELVRCSAGRLDAQRLQRFVTAFQSVTPLTIGELWAWPSALKLALVEHLRVRADILAATPCPPPATPIGSPARSGKRPRGPERLAGATSIRRSSPGCWCARASTARRRRRCGSSSTPRWRPQGQTVEDAIRVGRTAPGGRAGRDGEPDRQPPARSRRSTGASSSRASASSSRCFSAIRPASTAGWISAAAIGIAMRSKSWRIRPGTRQLRVALKSVERARQVAEQTPDARGAHVGYHLIGRGRPQFEKGVAWAPGLRRRIRRLFFRHATPGYLGAIAVGHARAGRRRGRLRPRARLAGSAARLGRAADAGAGQRADDPDRPADHQPAHPAAAAAAARSRSRARLGAHDGHRADDPRQRRARARISWRTSRSRRSATSIRTSTSRS